MWMLPLYLHVNQKSDDDDDDDDEDDSAQGMRGGYSLEVPQQGICNEYPQHMFLRRNKKNNKWIALLI